MKKILLALMMISSFAFSAGTYVCGSNSPSAFTSYGNFGSVVTTGTQTFVYTSFTTCPTSAGQPLAYVEATGMVYPNASYQITLYTFSINSGTYGRIYNKSTYNVYSQCPTNLYLYPDNTCKSTPLTPTCTANQYLENNVCIDNPICQLGTTLNTSTHTCTIDFPIASTDTLLTGSKLIHFEDGKMMLLRPDGSAEMWDKNTGEFIFPNRAYNGVIPPSASFNPLSFNPSEPIQYKELTFGDFVAFEFNQAGLALKSVANVLAGAVSLPIFMAISTKQQTPEGDIITQSRSANAISIDLSKMDFSNIDFSEYENTATATPQTIPNTDIQVQKITTPPNPNDPNNWAGAGSTIKGYSGVVSVGSVISLRPNNPNTALITSPTDVKIATIKPDGSVEATIFDKQDLKNTATNETPLPVKEIKITPEKLANDGTYSQEQTTQQSTIVPSTNQKESTNLSTGLPDVVDFNPKTGVKDGNLYSTSTGLPVGPGTPAGLPGVAPITPAPAGGTGSIDLSGVTSRLDKISNQFNKLLTDFDAPASNIPATAHNIPNVPTSLTSWESSWNDAKSSLNSVNEKATQLQSLYQNGFTFSLSGGTVLTCPYSSNLDLGVLNREITFDFCKILSPFRPVTYTLFYLFFVFLVLSFSFKLVLRLV